MEILAVLEEAYDLMVEWSILLLELTGGIIMLVTAVRSIIGLFRHTKHIPLVLAKGIALSLEFDMCGEVLRSTIVREYSELIILGAIVLVRVALTLLIHWEIKLEEEAHTEESSLSSAEKA